MTENNLSELVLALGKKLEDSFKKSAKKNAEMLRKIAEFEEKLDVFTKFKKI